MNHITIPVTIFNQNCSLIWCKKTGKGVIIDPGGEPYKLKYKIKLFRINIQQIWITHGHIDHVGAAKELSKFYNVPIFGPSEEDSFLLKNLHIQSQMFELEYIAPLNSINWLKNNDIISVGNLSFKVIHCPGHSPGHVMFWNEEKKFIIVGDILSNGCVGRTDLPGGNLKRLMYSIYNEIIPLPDDTIFSPGHGEVSTLGRERKINMFLKKNYLLNRFFTKI